jgi:hypothetical protein
VGSLVPTPPTLRVRGLGPHTQAFQSSQGLSSLTRDQYQPFSLSKCQPLPRPWSQTLLSNHRPVTSHQSPGRKLHISPSSQVSAEPRPHLHTSAYEFLLLYIEKARNWGIGKTWGHISNISSVILARNYCLTRFGAFSPFTFCLKMRSSHPLE